MEDQASKMTFSDMVHRMNSDASEILRLKMALEDANLQLSEAKELLRRFMAAAPEEDYQRILIKLDGDVLTFFIKNGDCICPTDGKGQRWKSDDCSLHSAKKQKPEVWTEGELKQLHAEADKLSDHLGLPKKRISGCPKCGGDHLPHFSCQERIGR